MNHAIEGHLDSIAQIIWLEDISSLDPTSARKKVTEILGGPSNIQVLISKLSDAHNHPKEMIDMIGVSAYLEYLRSKMGIQVADMKTPGTSPDIPVQFSEAKKASVSIGLDATAWILLDEKGGVYLQPRIRSALKSLNISTEEFQNKICSYHPGVGIPGFIVAMRALISKEEEFYGYGKPLGTPTDPVFVPGGGGGLTLFRDYFVDTHTPVIIPDFRWPNIDWIMSSKTGIPPVYTSFFNEEGNFQLEDLDSKLQEASFQKRKKVAIYLNFPNNPTGKYLQEWDAKRLNFILGRHSNLEINIVIDDPYGAYSVGMDGKMKKPLSYMIDTEKNPHVMVMELGSHGTKEAGVYGLRASIARIITSTDKSWEMQKKLWKMVRETFSMSPSLPQIIMAQAICGTNYDVFSPGESIDSQEIEKYLSARTQMQNYIRKNIEEMDQKIAEANIPYIQKFSSEPMNGTDGFYLSFLLSKEGRDKGLNLEELRRYSLTKKDKISFAIFDAPRSGDQLMRIALISGDKDMYVRILKENIEEMIKK